jgi:glycosyltransferase involved in cell wall biosynthesis
MSKVLILCAHRPKRSPSQRYRFEQYLPFLESKGFSFTFSYLLSENDDALFYSKGNLIIKILILFKGVLIRLKDLFRFKKFDIIFIQREALFFGTSTFEHAAFHSGAYVIFDFDDSIWLADTSPGNKKWEWIKKPDKFFTNIQAAHCVIAGNAYLADKAKPLAKNVVLIPTTIDTDIHFPKPALRNKETICIGWSGSISTIKHFETMLPVLQQIKNRYGARVKFKVIGDPDYVNKTLDVESLAWSEQTEVDLINSFDIGIMPLPDDEWANGKCGLKGLSYMACGVASIMSAVGVNNQIIQHGENGLLVSREAEWLENLILLIEDADLRNKLGENGRKTVLEKYSVNTYKSKYLDLFNNAQLRR